MAKNSKITSDKKTMTKSARVAARARSAGFYLRKNWLKALIALIIVIGLLLFANEYKNTKDQLNELKNPKTAGQTEVQVITTEVSKAVQLPTEESPTLATVSDITKLKGQVFFKNAQNGDKVLVYTKSGKALLYRPTDKKVIEYSNITFQDNQPAQATQPAPTQQTTPKR